MTIKYRSVFVIKLMITLKYNNLLVGVIQGFKIVKIKGDLKYINRQKKWLFAEKNGTVI
jgi:hypothetical protein